MPGNNPFGSAFAAKEDCRGASMSALPATDRFGIFPTAATAVTASPEISGDHIGAGDGHANDGPIEATPDQASGSTSDIRKAVIHARITEVLDGHARKSRGHYNFIQLPVPKDKIVITNRRGAYDIMTVLSTAHAPEITVYVRWIDSQRL
jgi:hypothetical protein